MSTKRDIPREDLERVFRILREAVTLPDQEHDKHRAMTLRALIELAETMTAPAANRKENR